MIMIVSMAMQHPPVEVVESLCLEKLVGLGTNKASEELLCQLVVLRLALLGFVLLVL